MPAEPSLTPDVSPAAESPPEEPEQAAADTDSLDADADTGQFPEELASVLAGSGALLAAGLCAALLAHRRQRLRRRRPGRRLTPVPPELSATRTAVTAGADTVTGDSAVL